MATKRTSVCLAKAKDDEPIFVLRAQDRSAPQIVDFWAAINQNRGNTSPKIRQARRVAKDMREWQAKHGSKEPD